jgi:hypothetical protein
MSSGKRVVTQAALTLPFLQPIHDLPLSLPDDSRGLPVYGYCCGALRRLIEAVRELPEHVESRELPALLRIHSQSSSKVQTNRSGPDLAPVSPSLCSACRFERRCQVELQTLATAFGIEPSIVLVRDAAHGCREANEADEWCSDANRPI